MSSCISRSCCRMPRLLQTRPNRCQTLSWCSWTNSTKRAPNIYQYKYNEYIKSDGINWDDTHWPLRVDNVKTWTIVFFLFFFSRVRTSDQRQNEMDLKKKGGEFERIFYPASHWFLINRRSIKLFESALSFQLIVVLGIRDSWRSPFIFMCKQKRHLA